MSILVQCPRCNGAVSIADRAAGKRVKCPHCAEAFLAPGISALEKVEDEDDWLSLDEKPLQSTPATPPTETASPVGNGISDEDDILGEFALPPLTTPQPKSLPNRGLPSLSKEEEALLARFAVTPMISRLKPNCLQSPSQHQPELRCLYRWELRKQIRPHQSRQPRQSMRRSIG